VNAAVFIRSLEGPFFSDLKRNLEVVQNENENKIKFTFFDSHWNQGTQNEYIEKALNNNFNFFIINPVTSKKEEIINTINKVVKANIPIIFYLPTSLSLIETFQNTPRTAIMTRDVEHSGILQSKILSDIRNTNKKSIDRNNDNILQYMMLQGTPDDLTTIARSKYSIRTLNEVNIKTQQLLSTACSWNRECARRTIESAFLVYGDKIDAIISNNDEMALGAIDALQKYGFNKGNKTKYISAVGVNGIDEAKALINQGIMTGTVIEDIPAQAKGIYDIGMNLISGNSITHNTNLKTIHNNVVKMPYYKYIVNYKNKISQYIYLIICVYFNFY